MVDKFIIGMLIFAGAILAVVDVLLTIKQSKTDREAYLNDN